MNEGPKAPRPPRALHDGCEVDDEADGGVGPDEDGAIDVADVGAAAVDDAVGDVVDDGNEAGADDDAAADDNDAGVADPDVVRGDADDEPAFGRERALGLLRSRAKMAYCGRGQWG